MKTTLPKRQRRVHARAITIATAILGLVVLASCDGEPQPTLQGYVEGDLLYMMPPNAGIVRSLDVERGEWVTSGTTLFAMDATRETAAVQETRMKLTQGEALLQDAQLGKRPTEIQALEAKLMQTQAALSLAVKVFERQKKLSTDRLISAEEMDQARSDAQQKQQAVRQLQADLATAQQGQRSHQVDAAGANVQAIKATITQAQWTLEQTTQTAPQDALVFETYFRPGEFAAQGRPVVSLLPPGRTKVLTFVPEANLSAVVLGSTATVTMDGSGQQAVGKVSFISPQAEFTPPVVYSRELRQKFTYKVEISFPTQVAAALHPGQPVGVQIEGVTP